MRLLYGNLLQECTALAMTSLDTDSFVENLYHPFMELACYCVGMDSTLSGEWADGRTVNAIAIAYHNAGSARVILRDDLGAVLLDETLALEVYDSVYYVARTQGVYSFEIQFSGGENVYVGYVYLGEYLEMPSFAVGGSFPISIRSSSAVSNGGQTYGVFARQLNGYKIKWPRMTNTERTLFADYVAAVQTCRPHFVDLFPEDHDEEPPFYGTLVSSIDITKRTEARYFYEVTAEWQEAR